MTMHKASLHSVIKNQFQEQKPLEQKQLEQN